VLFGEQNEPVLAAMCRCIQLHVGEWPPEKEKAGSGLLANSSTYARHATMHNALLEEGAWPTEHLERCRQGSSGLSCPHLAHFFAVRVGEKHLECAESRVDTLHSPSFVRICDFPPNSTFNVSTSHLRQVVARFSLTSRRVARLRKRRLNESWRVESHVEEITSSWNSVGQWVLWSGCQLLLI
jgi:hypothetical protein